MNSYDVVIGQTVTLQDDKDQVAYTVLDRHPLPGQWWLQNKATSQVSIHLYAPSAQLQLRKDPYHPTADTTINPDGTVTPVRYRAGVWVVTRSPKKNNRWAVVHSHLGSYALPVHRESSNIRKRAQAVALAQALYATYGNASADELRSKDDAAAAVGALVASIITN